jgi:flagellar biosynthesis protein FlhG
MGRRVILLDADLGTANADVLCDVRPSSTLAHVVAGRRSLDEAMTPAPGGFRLVAGASGLAQVDSLTEFERARLWQQIEQLESDADVILIDTGAGVGPNVMTFAAAADDLLVVTTPEPTAITDAYAVIKTVQRHREESPSIRLAVNMVRDAAEGHEVYHRIQGVCRRFLSLEMTYAGYIVSDPRVTQAVRRRRPFVLDAPHCDASACIGQLAHRIDRHAAEPRGTGFLRRMAVWLAS